MPEIDGRILREKNQSGKTFHYCGKTIYSNTLTTYRPYIMYTYQRRHTKTYTQTNRHTHTHSHKYIYGHLYKSFNVNKSMNSNWIVCPFRFGNEM